MARWSPLARWILPALAAAGLVSAARLGDYPVDAGPALDALLAGQLHRFLALQPLMGSVSVLARAPFALLAHGELGRYRAGVVPCALALAAVGVRLGRKRPLYGLLAVLTPASVAAVVNGHPEELLGAALCVAAVLLAPRRPLWAAVALGFAVATKQWAILAVPPVLLAAPPGRRLRVVALAAGVAALLTLPLLADSGAFAHTTNEAATAPTNTVRATWWFLAAHPTHLRLHVPAGLPSAFTSYRLAPALAQLTHPLIVLLAPLLGLLAWRRRADPLALLALVLLLRCVLDPVDNEYYHAPFLLALLAWEAQRRRPLPVATLLVCAGLWLTFRLDTGGAAAVVTNAVYLAWSLPAVAYLAGASGLVRARRASRVLAPLPASA